MSYNGSGTFLINTAGQPVVSGTVISSTAFNALTADLATGLSTCITKDGQTTVTANIPMGNNKITGLAVGTAATDAANLSQVQSTAAKLINSVSGADTVTGVLSPTLGAYAAGQMFYWVAAGDNTGAVTLNIDSLGAKSVTRDGSVALAAGDIKSGEVVVVVYDGTRFQVVSQLNSAGDARFANVSIASTLYVGGVATFTSGTAAAPAITTAGDTNTGIFFPAADTIAFAEGGVEAARFDSSGNMGLGVTPAAWGANSAIQLADTQSYSRYGMIRNAYYDGAAYRFLTSAPASLYQQSADEHAWYSVGTGIAGNPISFTQAMTLTSNGNLLLGRTTDAPTAGGRLALEGSGDTAVQITKAGVVAARLMAVNTALAFGVDLADGATERARITSGGDLLVGTTSAVNIGGRGSRINCAQSTNGAWAGGFVHSATTGTNAFGFAIYYSGSSPNNTQNPMLYCEDSTALRAEIRSNGGLANYQSNNADLSDARTKKDITPAASMWGKIGALEIVTYKYNDQTHDDVNLGVIAQQVESVEPVWVDADGFGETPEGEEPLKTVYTKDITFAAIKALQEAMARIEQLEAKVAALESA